MVPGVRMRLQGGPFDGCRVTAVYENGPVELPACWWVVRCVHSGVPVWWPYPIPRADVYRLDSERDGWTIYVYTDERLTGDPGRVAQRAMSFAGGIR